ncbi:MAG: hypothetical protein GX894_08660 [Clostridia bacterium]|jgi:hypothetical protein|nr:hypothetical protein [Clostridia bacterium]
MKNQREPAVFCWRITAAHTIAYFVAGVFAVVFMNYEGYLASERFASFMRQFGSPWIAAGPGLQVIRGLILAGVLYPFREVIFSRKGWLKLGLLIFGLCGISTIGPLDGSFEGLIYTTFTLKEHLLGLPEALLYTFLFSFLVYAWNKKGGKAWNIIAGCLVGLIIFFSLMGVLAALNLLPQV